MAEEDFSDLLQPIGTVKDLPSQSTASSAYFDLFHDDSVLAGLVEDALETPLRTFDAIMGFNYELLVIIYKNVEVWRDDQQRRFTHAALTAAFNPLLLARTNVLRGYFFDSQLTLRTSQEWLARAMLFHEDADAVIEFIENGNIDNGKILSRLQTIFDGKDSVTGTSTRKLLGRLYGRRSDLGHASFQALTLRTFPRAPKATSRQVRRKLAEQLGVGTIFGGYCTLEMGFGAFLDLIPAAESLLQILAAQIPGDNDDIRVRQAALRSDAEDICNTMRSQFERTQ